MAVYYFAPSQTSGQTQHVAHDYITLTTTSSVAAGALCAFSNVSLNLTDQFSNTNYTIHVNQTGAQTVSYYVIFVAAPVSTSAFSLGFYNLTGGTIPSNTTFYVAYTCIGA